MQAGLSTTEQAGEGEASRRAAGPAVDVLIPTCNRPTALAITLTALIAQSWSPLRVVVSDQSDACRLADSREFSTALSVLRATGREVVLPAPAWVSFRPPLYSTIDCSSHPGISNLAVAFSGLWFTVRIGLMVHIH